MAGKGKAKGGRPKAITPELEAVILERLASEPVERVFSDPALPDKSTFYNHCKASPQFFDASARARALRALVELDEAEQAMAGLTAKATGAEVAVLRERMQHARWKVSRMLSKYYGDRVALTGEGGGPIAVERIERVVIDPRQDST